MVQRLKAEIRKKIIEQRNALSETEKKNMSNGIIRKLVSEPHFIEAKCVAFYMPVRGEVDVAPIIEKTARLGKEVLLPVVADGHRIELCRFMSLYDMKKGAFGILEPGSRIPMTREPDVIILPGVAFGLCMHRLGYGKGYYDRLLAKLPSYRIGICYDFQVLESLPKHEDDQRMHKIITEKREIE